MNKNKHRQHNAHVDHEVRVTNFAGFGADAYNISPQRRRRVRPNAWVRVRSSSRQHQTASVFVVGFTALIAMGGLSALTRMTSAATNDPVTPSATVPAAQLTATKALPND